MAVGHHAQGIRLCYLGHHLCPAGGLGDGGRVAGKGGEHTSEASQCSRCLVDEDVGIGERLAAVLLGGRLHRPLRQHPQAAHGDAPVLRHALGRLRGGTRGMHAVVRCPGRGDVRRSIQACVGPQCRMALCRVVHRHLSGGPFALRGNRKDAHGTANCTRDCCDPAGRLDHPQVRPWLAWARICGRGGLGAAGCAFRAKRAKGGAGGGSGRACYFGRRKCVQPCIPRDGPQETQLRGYAQPKRKAD
mmetsp:Transcript_25897/g.50602  ORF Transcript_25897/g.50602 Transcript_25897/m.50602 type:complete len:246 (-) Transcript_25897:261-998(-)